MKAISRRAGFSLVEALVLSLIVLFLFFVFLRPTVHRQPGKAQRIKCVSNLKNVALAIRIHAVDHDGLYPGPYFLSNSVDFASLSAADYFGLISNQLSTPKILVCPSDGSTFTTNSPPKEPAAKISYFGSLTATDSTPEFVTNQSGESGVVLPGTPSTTFLAGDRNLQINGHPLPPGLAKLRKDSALSWSTAMHNEEGNIAMADGSVHQFTSPALRQAMASSEVEINLILIP